jgi:hypothetical protein
VSAVYGAEHRVLVEITITKKRKWKRAMNGTRS